MSAYAPYDNATAASPPSIPLSAPCSRNGRRTKPLVAPTRRMMAISRLRCSTAMRIVVPMMMIATVANAAPRSEEHTSELQSRLHLVCRLLLEKKKKQEDAWQGWV